MNMYEKIYLELPKDEKRVGTLKKKMREYAQRLQDFKERIETEHSNWHPEYIMSFVKQSQNYMNLIVLSELFLTPKVETTNFSLELGEEGPIYDKKSLDRYLLACAIIDDYCKTGGKNCRRGTGLN